MRSRLFVAYSRRDSAWILFSGLLIAVQLLAGGLGMASAQTPEVSSPAPPTATATPRPTPPTASPSSPGTGQNPGQDERIKLDTDLVTLTVTVTDPYNRLVTGLDRQHFELFEDKVKQSIEFFNDDDVPVSLGIVFDVSGSMKGKLDRARDSLRAFVETSHQEDDFFRSGSISGPTSSPSSRTETRSSTS